MLRADAGVTELTLAPTVDAALNNAEQSSTDLLWEQLKPFRILEDRLEEDSYSALVRFMTPFVVHNLDLNNQKISENLTTYNVPVAWQSALEEVLSDPAGSEEFFRRVKIAKEWLWGSKMQPAMLGEPSLETLTDQELESLKDEIRWIKTHIQIPPITTIANQFNVLCTNISALSRAGKLTAEQMLDLIAEFGFGFSTLSLMGQSLWRPRDYAGSFDMMEAIYTFYDSEGSVVMGDASVEGWNRLLLSTTSAQDVNDRKSVIVEDLLQFRGKELAQKTPLKVLNFASGPGRLEADFWEEMEVLGLRPNIEWQCVDGDEKAVEFSRLRLQEKPEITVKHGNVIRALHNRDWQNQFDEVMTVGLLDYFDDAFTVKALRQFYSLLKPGGAFSIGQFDTSHADQPFLELTNWHLFRRDEATMRDLLTQAGVPPECIEIKKISAEGPQLIVRAVKPN